MSLQKQPTAGQQGCGQRLQQINVGCWRSIVPAGFHICSRIPWFCKDADAEWVSESLSRKEAWRQLPLSHKIAPLLFPLWFIVTAKQVYVVYPDGVHAQEDNGLMIRLMKTWANLTTRVFLLTRCDWMYGCVGQARLKFVRLPKSSTGRRTSCLMGNGETMDSCIVLPLYCPWKHCPIISTPRDVWKQRWTRCSLRDVFCYR